MSTELSPLGGIDGYYPRLCGTIQVWPVWVKYYPRGTKRAM